MDTRFECSVDDAARLDRLRSLGLLDTPAEKDFDDIVQLASDICETPIALISLVESDRQFFKAKIGLDAGGTPIEQSVCAYTMSHGGVLEIPDTRDDSRTCANALVDDGVVDMKFYAGAPLVTCDGQPLGALCVLDRHPRQLSDFQRKALATLARQVNAQIGLRESLRLSEEASDNLREALDQQDILRREIDHRVKNSLLQVTSLLRLQSRRSSDENVRTALAEAERRIAAIAAVHAELHQVGSGQTVNLARYLDRLATSLRATLPPNIALDVQCDAIAFPTDQATALAIIVNEFVSNSAKHAFSGGAGRISVAVQETPGGLTARLADDGVGADASAFEKSDGIGMMVMRASAAQIGGTLDIEPVENGLAIVLSLPVAAQSGASM